MGLLDVHRRLPTSQQGDSGRLAVEEGRRREKTRTERPAPAPSQSNLQRPIMPLNNVVQHQSSNGPFVGHCLLTVRKVQQLMNDALVRVSDTLCREDEREQPPVARYCRVSSLLSILRPTCPCCVVWVGLCGHGCWMRRKEQQRCCAVQLITREALATATAPNSYGLLITL